MSLGLSIDIASVSLSGCAGRQSSGGSSTVYFAWNDADTWDDTGTWAEVGLSRVEASFLGVAVLSVASVNAALEAFVEVP